MLVYVTRGVPPSVSETPPASILLGRPLRKAFFIRICPLAGLYDRSIQNSPPPPCVVFAPVVWFVDSTVIVVLIRRNPGLSGSASTGPSLNLKRCAVCVLASTDSISTVPPGFAAATP